MGSLTRPRPTTSSCAERCALLGEGDDTLTGANQDVRDAGVQDAEVDEDPRLRGKRGHTHSHTNEDRSNGVIVRHHHQPEAQRRRNHESADGSKGSRLRCVADIARVEVEADVQHQQDDAQFPEHHEGVDRIREARAAVVRG